MRSWLLFIGSVVAALILLALLATGFPSASPIIFLIGTPIVVVGAGLGAKFVQRRIAARRQKHVGGHA
ncbi:MULTISPECIES: hypothetical protein [unclassified Microbacterium]|uniref:hypothetical protein n=1 Tax=unclassified Microbacterium TaxID=2609290 RepID=UPI001604C186|nr:MULTISPECIES: hypothetical protein [unclassified Microbacterium]QNA93601.1 hypothetical protein G4G29_17180 [Microbacterium sp. Se63.02b]QYM63861.1 hypothetical protein K1X59_17250 [Microbacterium sp. Se5.02b]